MHGVHIPKGTSQQENYHNLLSKFVRSSSTSSVKTLSNTLLQFNFRVFLHKGVQHRGHQQHYCESPWIFERAATSWNSCFNTILSCNLDPECASPYSGFPLPQSRDTTKLPRNFQFGCEYCPEESAPDIIVERVELLSKLLDFLVVEGLSQSFDNAHKNLSTVSKDAQQFAKYLYSFNFPPPIPS